MGPAIGNNTLHLQLHRHLILDHVIGPAPILACALSYPSCGRIQRSPSFENNFDGDVQNKSYSRSPLPAASVNGHGKCARLPEADAVAKISVNFVKAQKVTEGDGRPKASDYNKVAKEVILAAAAIYRCLISTSNTSPSPSEEAEMIKQAWDRANEDTAQGILIALSPLIAKMISARGSQIRSKVKACTVMYVETLYGFGSGHGKSIIKQNRKLAEELKHNNSGYLYKNLDNKFGLYQHPIIQKFTNKVWFNNPRDEGIVYVDLFDPISVVLVLRLILSSVRLIVDTEFIPFTGTTISFMEAIALVLTVVECGIDSWATGVKLEVPFYSSEYKPVYTTHVKTLKVFGVATSKHDLLGKLQKSTFNFGRIHAGVSLAVSQEGPVLSASAFAAALKEYEEDTNTEEDGEDLD
ncbi:hypothetical protein B0H34DRAFT_802876 [Crassisporium funariophilum]|nr:hypothetical protein B0H34DRAFT_802876 [Crassisporium funariophilum]